MSDLYKAVAVMVACAFIISVAIANIFDSCVPKNSQTQELSIRDCVPVPTYSIEQYCLDGFYYYVLTSSQSISMHPRLTEDGKLVKCEVEGTMTNNGVGPTPWLENREVINYRTMVGPCGGR